ncbi:MAG: tetratricopeptide repeat protein [Gammaproteobacteria bacterium]|nr:tetratricopeptide repeat protein [Gammaproteobacteria bacterium]
MRCLLLLRCCIVAVSLTVTIAVADQLTLGDIEYVKDLSYLDTLPERKNGGSAIFEYRKFLQIAKPGSTERRQVLVRLAELEIELAEERLASDDITEQQQLVIEQGIASAVDLFETALREYNKHDDNHRVLYQLARAYDINAQPERLKSTLINLVSVYPGSEFYTQSQFRLAEGYFIEQKYSDALVAYTAVLSQDSIYFDNALYKRGWVYFKQAKYKLALNDFVAVLDNLKFGNEKELTRIEDELYADSLRVISLSFSSLKGVKSVNQFFAKRKPGPYIKDIYYSLGQLYLQQKRYADTADSYMAFVNIYKNSRHSPDLALETIDVWRKSKFPEKVISARQDFSRKFSLSSAYWLENDIDKFEGIKISLKYNIRLLAEYHHSLGQKKKSDSEKREALHWYAEYIESFPLDKNTAHMHFLYAELLSELRRYAQAFKAYEAVAYNYDKTKETTEAAYSAVLVATNVAKLAKSGTKNKLKWQETVVKTTLRFAEQYPEDKRLKNTLLHVAEIQYEQGKFLDAIDMAELVLPQSSPEQKKKALLILAHGQFELKLYSNAEKSYLQLLKIRGKKHKDYKEIRKRVAISIYKEAEIALKAGDSKQAIQMFLRLKKVVPESSIVSVAEYDAATELLKMKEWGRAIKVLARFRKSYPKHKLQNEVTTKLAVAYNEKKQYANVAAEYKRILKFTKSKKKRRLIAFQIAEFYEKAGKDWKALEGYQSYLSKYARPFDIAMETRQKIIDLYGKLNQSKKQRQWRNKLIVAEKAAGKARTDRSRYLAAKAALKLADRDYLHYSWATLKAPFKKNLKIKKKRMKAAVNSFANVIRYKVAETTTEATYKIGLVYNEFSKALMKSERPKKLSAEELEQYDILLEEQAFPFEEKAIEFYQSNLKRTRDSIYDQWVKKSIDNLAKLYPGRYLRNEKLESVIDAP